MKLVVAKTQLLNALNIVSRAISPKNPRSILTGVKFELNKNGLFLTGSDSDVSIVTKIPLEENGNNIITVFEPGVTVISCKYILEIVRKLEGEFINLETFDDSVIKITDHISNFSLNCMDNKAYPVLDLNVSGNTIRLQTSELNEIISQTVFAASDKETRPILTGVNFKCLGSSLECVATDSYRLAKKVVNVNDAPTFNVTIPAKTLSEIQKIMSDQPSVELSVSDKKVIFRMANTLLSTRVINGMYPDTSKLVPNSFEYNLQTMAHAFVSSIDRASLLSIDRNNIVKLSMSNERVNLTSNSQEIGSVVESIQNYKYEGSRLDISFTAKYVTEAIKALGSEEITIGFNGDMKAFVIRNKEDKTALQLVLPVRTY